jgi:hypothetical protein
MKKLFAILVFAFFCTNTAFAASPIKLSLVHPLGLPPVEEVNGLDLGLIGTGTDDVTGLQLSFIYALTDDMTGVQASIYGRAEEFTGIQYSFLNSGGDVMGAQLGFVNLADSMTGLQWGVVNRVNTMGTGVQIGLVNIIKNGKLPFMVLVNAKF